MSVRPSLARLSAALLFASSSLAFAMLVPSTVAAQGVVGSEWEGVPEFVASDERFTFELRLGAYQGNLGPAAAAFNGDLGPLLELELDVHLVRIPYIGPLAIGGHFGWVEWTGPATASGGSNVGDTGMSVLPMGLVAAWRIDGLARELSVPFVVTPKIGVDFGYWRTGTAGTSDAEGWSIGLRWAVQFALELDFLEPRAARRVDQEWGINHTVIFCELFGSTMGGGSFLPVGSDLAWVAGLGLTF